MCSFKDKIVTWLILFTLQFFANNATGQLYPVSNQYSNHGIVINPAESGKDGALSMTLGYRNQWFGFDGSPKTISVSAHAPFKNDKMGLGILVLSDSYGIVNHTTLRGNYAYRIELGRGVLALGLSVSAVRMDVSPSRLVAEHPEDEFINGLGQSATKPNFGTGVYYRANKYYLGFCVPELLSYNWDESSQNYQSIQDQSKYNYFGYGGCQIRLHPHVTFEPSVMARFFNGNDLQFNITPQLAISDRIWIGANYRTEGTMAALLSCKIDHQLSVGYAYDFEMGDKQHFLNNSHEIMLKYILKYKTQVVVPR